MNFQHQRGALNWGLSFCWFKVVLLGSPRFLDSGRSAFNCFFRVEKIFQNSSMAARLIGSSSVPSFGANGLILGPWLMDYLTVNV